MRLDRAKTAVIFGSAFSLICGIQLIRAWHADEGLDLLWLLGMLLGAGLAFAEYGNWEN